MVAVLIPFCLVPFLFFLWLPADKLSSRARRWRPASPHSLFFFLFSCSSVMPLYAWKAAAGLIFLPSPFLFSVGLHGEFKSDCSIFFPLFPLFSWPPESTRLMVPRGEIPFSHRGKKEDERKRLSIFSSSLLADSAEGMERDK